VRRRKQRTSTYHPETAGGQKFISPPRPPFLFARLLLGFAKIFSEADEELFD
jgi:hypothetical protein